MPGYPRTEDEVLAFRPRTARQWEMLPDGRVAILVPKFGGRILGRWLQPRLHNPFFLIHLDDVGTFVWQQCNGVRDGRQIVEALQERFPDMAQVQARFIFFMRQLWSQGHVG